MIPLPAAGRLGMLRSEDMDGSSISGTIQHERSVSLAVCNPCLLGAVLEFGALVSYS